MYQMDIRLEDSDTEIQSFYRHGGYAAPEVDSGPSVTMCAAGPTQPDLVEYIASLQHIDGSWSLNSAELEVIDFYVSCPVQDSHDSMMAGFPGDTEPQRRTVSTAIMIELLELEFGSRREEWGLMAEKAYTWLRVHGVPHPNGADWVEVARHFLLTTS
jgi:hypothetical protein